jgi:hypothetical protein
VRPRRNLEDLLTNRFLLFQKNIGELNIKDWALVEEAIQDDLKAGPEREFYTNALEHSRVGNLRLAVVESVISLEILLAQWLHQVLPRRGVRKVKDLLKPQLDLFTRLNLLLPILLRADDPRLELVSLDDVARTVKLRNGIVHGTGNLPDNVSPDSIRSGVTAVLQLARLLAFERDALTREPEFDKLAETIGRAFGLPKPKIYALSRHEYSALSTFHLRTNSLMTVGCWKSRMVSIRRSSNTIRAFGQEAIRPSRRWRSRREAKRRRFGWKDS